MSPLCHLLLQFRDPSLEVARHWDPVTRSDQVVRWHEFQRDVVGLRNRIVSEPEGAWVLLTEDAYAFAVGLFALWHAGRYAISPPNRQPSSLRTLRTQAVGVLSDRPDWFPESACLDPTKHAEPVDSACLGPLDPDALAMELFTSGTTGVEKPVTKRIRHLEDEVRELHAAWSTAVGGASFFSAASHQHVYGLLFGVLWPLHAGCVFQRHHYLHPGELVPRMQDAGDCVLASVPTHLKRLARHVHAPTLQGVCRTVFSSGGPLAPDTAHDIARALGAPPIEVLGSTETGGIAWRTQEPGSGSGHWTPFSSVRVACDGEDNLLRVSSPFVSVDAGEDGFATGDRISLQSDGTFVLEGRSDRVVKIGEKRLDLTRMESEIRARSSIDEVALATIEREAELRVAATIVPSEEGWTLIQQRGERAFVHGLRAGLADAWDPVLHPRFWRVVSRLPLNPQGKLTLGALRRLFLAPEPVASDPDRPEVLEQFRGVDFLERACRVPRDLGCFEGHFPGCPIVPGVLQLDWAMELSAELLEGARRVEEIESAKFSAPLGPDDSFRINVRVVDESRIAFRIAGDEVEYARGRICLSATPRTGR
ncbi:MAG: acyl-CoA synthetase [Deltaproteobacteria bacterium]|nr:acyl-CoA synthetase [Deltaproteobacteria bacterium]